MNETCLKINIVPRHREKKREEKALVAKIQTYKHTIQ